MRRIVWGLALALPLAFAVPACSKANNVDQSEKTTNNVFSARIDDEGGPFGDRKLGPGAFVKQFAVDQETEFSVRTADAGEYSSLPADAVGDVYSFEPRDTVFNTDVDVYLPRPAGVTYFQAYFSSDGQSWQPLSGKVDVEAKTVHFLVTSFGYFVVVSRDIPMSGTGGMAGRAGTAGGVAGGSAVGGGPTGPVTDACEVDVGVPNAKLAEVEGSVSAADQSEVQWRTRDGFAAYSPASHMLTLLFTDYGQACGSAQAAGSSHSNAGSEPLGRAAGSALSASFVMPSSPMPGHYVGGDSTFANFDTECSPDYAKQDATVTLDIMSSDSNTIEGTVNIVDGATGRMVSGHFIVPFCELPETSGAPCCPR